MLRWLGNAALAGQRRAGWATPRWLGNAALAGQRRVDHDVWGHDTPPNITQSS
jgi:hypothetical protein